MNARLTKKRVLIVRVPKVGVSRGGIAIPQQYNDDDKRWQIIALSPNIVDPDVQRGDNVVVDFDRGFVEMPSGARLVDVSQLLMKW